MYAKFESIVEEIDVLVAERKELSAIGPHFKIAHRYGQGTDCQPGEEISWVLLMHRSHEYLLPLSASLLSMFDYLSQHRLPQNAEQIVRGMRHAFYTQHGNNVNAGQARTISRSSVKVYIERIRRALQVAFNEAQMKLDPYAVLMSEPTETNEIRYRLKAHVERVHI
jgi:hypothetical protein